MGKIFGISDLPVSTIMTAFEPIRVPEPVCKTVGKKVPSVPRDTFETQKVITKSSNPFIKMRNGFGKLMKHFSKKN